MASVTLVGTRLATQGEEFVFRGEASACEECPYRDQCLNLAPGSRYRITSVREEANTLNCNVHDTGVTAVEVEPAPITAAVSDNSAFAGSKVSLEGACPHTDCPSHDYCEPAGVSVDDEYRIENVLGDPPHDHCSLDRELTLVELAAKDGE